MQRASLIAGQGAEQPLEAASPASLLQHFFEGTSSSFPIAKNSNLQSWCQISCWVRRTGRLCMIKEQTGKSSEILVTAYMASKGLFPAALNLSLSTAGALSSSNSSIIGLPLSLLLVFQTCDFQTGSLSVVHHLPWLVGTSEGTIML